MDFVEVMEIEDGLIGRPVACLRSHTMGLIDHRAQLLAMVAIFGVPCFCLEGERSPLLAH